MRSHCWFLKKAICAATGPAYGLGRDDASLRSSSRSTFVFITGFVLIGRNLAEGDLRKSLKDIQLQHLRDMVQSVPTNFPAPVPRPYRPKTCRAEAACSCANYTVARHRTRLSGRLPKWLKLRNTRREHMFSGLPPEADIRRAGCDFRVVPTTDLSIATQQQRRHSTSAKSACS
jgi:hypothetical protein